MLLNILYGYIAISYLLGIIGGIYSFKNKHGMSILSNLFIILISPIIMPYVVYIAYKIYTDKEPEIG